jgi:hypothetical protein
MAESEIKQNSRQVKIESDKGKQTEKDKGAKEKNETGGKKNWVIAIFLLTIILGLIFSLRSGMPELSFGLPNLDLNLDLFGSKVYRF